MARTGTLSSGRSVTSQIAAAPLRSALRAVALGGAALLIGLLPLLSFASESDWPQSLYLPGIAVSATVGQVVPGKEFHNEVLGRCDVLLWITADGYSRVAQVIKSTGHSHLDEACLRAAIGGKKWLPAEDATGPIDRWAILPVTWEVQTAKGPSAPDVFAPSAPLAPDQVLPVKLSDYPKGALERGAHGDSWVHVDVSDSGQVLDVRISQSSGSSDLDQAALAAIRSAHFSPAFKDRKPVNSNAEVVVSWILPGPH
jgi:TonB family protein